MSAEVLVSGRPSVPRQSSATGRAHQVVVNDPALPKHGWTASPLPRGDCLVILHFCQQGCLRHCLKELSPTALTKPKSRMPFQRSCPVFSQC